MADPENKLAREQALADTCARFGWAVIKLLLASDITLAEMAKRIGMSRARAERLLLEPSRLSLNNISDMFLAFGAEPGFSLMRRGGLPERRAESPAWRPMTHDVSALALVAATTV